MLAAVPVVFRGSDAVQTIRDSFFKTNFENVILPIMLSLVFACFFLFVYSCRIPRYCDYGHFHSLHWKSTKRVKFVITACCWWILQPGKIKQHLPVLHCVSQCSKSSFIINYSCSPLLAPAPSRRRRKGGSPYSLSIYSLKFVSQRILNLTQVSIMASYLLVLSLCISDLAFTLFTMNGMAFGSRKFMKVKYKRFLYNLNLQRVHLPQ